jgi:HPt (histidine-containing phosphotransfer) domain-containing protein
LGGSAPVEAPTKRPFSDRLSQVPGFEVAPVLARLSGREPVLERVLRNFARQYAQGVAALVDPTTTTEDLHHAAHSLRGAVATVGAVGVQQLAQALELRIREGAAGATLHAQAVAVNQALCDLVLALNEAMGPEA